MELIIPNKTDLQRHRFLKRRAVMVREMAYAPYSRFLVGAAIVTNNNHTFVGCNVESADYDGTHAEESALSAMVAAGWRCPAWLVVMASLENDQPVSTIPCGKCLQKLKEFSSLSGIDLNIFVAAGGQDEIRIAKLSQLLPVSFGPADIGIDLAKYRR